MPKGSNNKNRPALLFALLVASSCSSWKAYTQKYNINEVTTFKNV